MTQPLPQRLQELAAGYVLGNLDQQELQEFLNLSEQYPDQEKFTDELQTLIHQLPYSLTEQHPPAILEDRILKTANPQKGQFKWKIWTLSLSTIAAMILGIDNLRMRHELAQIKSSPVQIATSAQVLNANWGGITQVLEDHIRAKQRGEQAIEIKAQAQHELFKILQSKDLVLPEMPPKLSSETVKFLGGAICQFEQTVGIRVMYKNQGKQAISLYQLHRASTPNFPIFLSDPVVIQNESGPNLILWGNEEFLFAIVADLPQDELDKLSRNLDYTAI